MFNIKQCVVRNMINKIEAIEEAIKYKCYLPALSLALTIPDICGQIEYPQFVYRNGNKEVRNVGKQYIEWFNNWVEVYYADDTGFSEDWKRAKKPYFTGKMCYKLRCAFLHSGNSDIEDFGKKEDDEFIYSYYFNLCLNGCDSWGPTWGIKEEGNGKIIKEITVSINVEILCNNICSAARRYYKYKGEKCFEDHKINVIDIKYELDKLRVR